MANNASHKKKVNACAPGKIILFGEHAVVYGHPAIAAPVSQIQACCQVRANFDGQGICLETPDLPEKIQQVPGQIIAAFKHTDKALIAAVYQVLTHLQQQTWPDLTLTIQSDIPLGRGLGSGAAVSCAVIRAVATYFGQQLTPQVVSELVYQVEQIHHGTPSGIDNSVIAFNQAIIYAKNQPIEYLNLGGSFTFVIGDTGIVSPTHRVVGDLRNRWQADPEAYGRYFAQIAQIVQAAKGALEQGNQQQLGIYLNKNHEHLQTLGVSHASLDRLVEAAMTSGALGAKLSGAGWGGTMMALVRPDQAKTVRQALIEAGAVQSFITTIE